MIPGENVTVEADRIVWELRMPRVLGALSVGAALAICGVVLQSLTRNELADPYLLGISSGSTVGVVAVIVFGLSLPLVPESLTLTAAAFGGAILAMVLVLGLATGRSGACRRAAPFWRVSPSDSCVPPSRRCPSWCSGNATSPAW